MTRFVEVTARSQREDIRRPRGPHTRLRQVDRRIHPHRTGIWPQTMTDRHTATKIMKGAAAEAADSSIDSITKTAPSLPVIKTCSPASATRNTSAARKSSGRERRSSSRDRGSTADTSLTSATMTTTTIRPTPRDRDRPADTDRRIVRSPGADTRSTTTTRRRRPRRVQSHRTTGTTGAAERAGTTKLTRPATNETHTRAKEATGVEAEAAASAAVVAAVLMARQAAPKSALSAI